MGHRPGFARPATVIVLATLVAACSSSQDKRPQGSLAVAFEASRVAPGVQAANSSDDPTTRLKAASISVADVEARSTDGFWVPFDSGVSTVIDLLPLADGGRSVTLSPELLSEDQYNALQLRITEVGLTRTDGTRVTIAPPGAGWVVLTPVDFGVVNGRTTIVAVRVRVDLSFKLVNGEFEFEPELELAGIKHD